MYSPQSYISSIINVKTPKIHDDPRISSSPDGTADHELENQEDRSFIESKPNSVSRHPFGII